MIFEVDIKVLIVGPFVQIISRWIKTFFSLDIYSIIACPGPIIERNGEVTKYFKLS